MRLTNELLNFAGAFAVIVTMYAESFFVTVTATKSLTLCGKFMSHSAHCSSLALRFSLAASTFKCLPFAFAIVFFDCNFLFGRDYVAGANVNFPWNSKSVFSAYFCQYFKPFFLRCRLSKGKVECRHKIAFRQHWLCQSCFRQGRSNFQV